MPPGNDQLLRNTKLTKLTKLTGLRTERIEARFDTFHVFLVSLVFDAFRVSMYFSFVSLSFPEVIESSQPDTRDSVPGQPGYQSAGSHARQGTRQRGAGPGLKTVLETGRA